MAYVVCYVAGVVTPLALLAIIFATVGAVRDEEQQLTRR
jgi:cytochrome c biogenesis protein CcdA